jgi:hypothetical protein
MTALKLAMKREDHRPRRKPKGDHIYEWLMRFMGDVWFWSSWKVTEQKRFSFLRWCWLVRWRMNRSDKNTIWYFKKDVPLCDPFCCCVIVEGKKDSSTSLMFGNLDTIPTALSVNNSCQTRIEDGSLSKCHDTWPDI